MILTKGKSLQQVVDEITNALIAQGGPSVSEFGGCEYTNAEGKHCAVGFLLDNVKYAGCVHDLLSYEPKLAGVNYDFLYKYKDEFSVIQAIHDGCYPDLGDIEETLATLRFDVQRLWDFCNTADYKIQLMG